MGASASGQDGIRTGFTLTSETSPQKDKICEMMVFKTLDISQQRTMIYETHEQVR